MINTSLQSLFSDVKNVNKATIIIEVDMTPSKLMESLATEVLKELERIAPYTGFRDVSDLEVEDIHKYLCTLTWMRCERVNGPSPSFKDYKKLEKRLAVPVMAYQLLIAIGICTDRDFSLQFKPVYSIDEKDLLAPEEMAAISDIMTRLEANGMKVVYGTPREIEGELDFMALCHVEDTVVGYKQSHPVYGFLASFFEQKKLNEVTGMMCRVIYGYDSDYQVQIAQIFRALNSDRSS